MKVPIKNGSDSPSGGIQVLCTLGPASLNNTVIRRLEDRGVSLFRINLSHTPIERLKECIQIIQACSSTPICIDSEGAQVRTGVMAAGTEVRDRQLLTLTAEAITGDDEKIPLTPLSVFSHLKPGHLVALDFDSALLLIESTGEGFARAVVLNGGKVGSNKAVSVTPAPPLPALSPKDKAAVALSLEFGITDFALSFANSREDVLEFRSLVGESARIIAKIESKLGVRNLDTILDAADAILIDRGDLSREVPMENMPLLQKVIIGKANSRDRPVYVATNLLESMLTSRKPTRAELNDVINTLIDGASGLVLAAETAIGQQPVMAVDTLFSLISLYVRSLDGCRIGDLLTPLSSILPPFHGGRQPTWTSHSGTGGASGLMSGLPVVEIDQETAMDVEQIGQGVYSPLRGFMAQNQLESVLDRYSLPDGTIWTMPIILQVSRAAAAKVQVGMTVELGEPGAAFPAGMLHVEDKFEVDLQELTRRWFGTSDSGHSGVARVLGRGNWILGGKITSSGLSQMLSPYSLSPEQVRAVFTSKGWSRVVGFHTRNVPHRGHEFLIRESLARSYADGILIHPVVGPKKRGDFSADTIIGAYDCLIREAFPQAMLAAFPTYSRYSGPREAVFTALCRKNYGCTHFVVGRDHTGVGSFYGERSAQQLFIGLGDLGIRPIFFDKVYHCDKCGRAVEHCDHDPVNFRDISGTMVRDSLRAGLDIPEWCLRPALSDWLHRRMAEGKSLFVGGLISE